MANIVIDSYNGNGTTLGNYVDSILKQNGEMGGVALAPHKNFWDTLNYRILPPGMFPMWTSDLTRLIPFWY